MSSYMAHPGKPKLKLPAGACDTHFHVFGPERAFPYAPERSYTPAGEAPKEKLFALHDFLGIERGVVVQSNAHGLDNSASADLIAARPANYRGVALVAPNVSDAALKKLNEQGFRGARFHFMKHLGRGAAMDEILALAPRLAAIGWHLQIHMESALIAEMAGALKRSPVPIVIDHMGRIDASLGPHQKPFRDLMELLKDRNVWVKVSGSERASRQPSPWRDAVPFAKRLVAEFGDRTLWGTDWPHPNLKEVPDDGVLVDLLSEIAPSEAQRHALLVENPQRFYGFE
ncbi:MAG TPA: amidohydrolase family protein [Burkholderiales bacterium]|nr:amidohydrolase family protein [Burkholderiales bacterium]